MSDMVESPFAGSMATQAASAGAMVSSSRQVAEVQAMHLIARANPRNQVAATDKILNAFTRPSLAEVAKYQYAKGGSDIDGPSIRAAEAIAQLWGNIEFGFREFSRGIGPDGVSYSEIEAFAIDLEVTTRRPIQFIVRHWRDTKKGGYPLRDEREIYELYSNMAQRRVRACILAIVPGDVVEAAMKQAEVTLHTKADTSPEAMAKMLDAFMPFGVMKEHIEKRIQRRLDAITAAQVVNLKKIYASLRDAMSEPRDWFEMDGAAPAPTPRPEKGAYPQDQFEKNLPGWKKMIADGKKTADQVIATAESKGTLSEDQKAAIRAVAKNADTPVASGDGAAPAMIEALRNKAAAMAISDTDICKHLQIESLDGITVAQVEQALKFIDNPV